MRMPPDVSRKHRVNGHTTAEMLRAMRNNDL